MKTILVYGDSNSNGVAPLAERGVSVRMPAPQRWPVVMAKGLGDEYEVIVEALPGRTTVHDDPVYGAHRNGLTVLPAVLFSHAPIDLVILMLGTNDLKMLFNAPAVDIAASVGRLCDEIRNSGTARDILVVCPAPVREMGCLAGVFEGAETRGAGLFVHMMQEAAKRDCAFLDAGAHVVSDPLDGVHMSVESHSVLGTAVAAAVRDRMKRRPDGKAP